MGVDMRAVNVLEPSYATANYRERKSGGWTYHLNWSGMQAMAEEMDRAGVLDTDTEAPPFPKWPGEKHFEDLNECDEMGHYQGAIDEVGREHLAATVVHRRTLGEHGKVPMFKFGSNDDWIVTPPECLWIAEALTFRVLLIEEGRWRALVEEFIAFNLRCAKQASGYAVG